MSSLIRQRILAPLSPRPDDLQPTPPVTVTWRWSSGGFLPALTGSRPLNPHHFPPLLHHGDLDRQATWSGRTCQVGLCGGQTGILPTAAMRQPQTFTKRQLSCEKGIWICATSMTSQRKAHAPSSHDENLKSSNLSRKGNNHNLFQRT